MPIFQIKDVFEITNRGVYLSGDIIEGVLNAGDVVLLKAPYKVNSIEFVRRRINGAIQEHAALAIGPSPEVIAARETLIDTQVQVLSKS